MRAAVTLGQSLYFTRLLQKPTPTSSVALTLIQETQSQALDLDDLMEK